MRSGSWYTLEAGPSITFYRNGDEAGEAGVLAGLHLLAEVGYRFIYLGASFRPGIADDPYYGTGFDVAWSPHLRLVFGRRK